MMLKRLWHSKIGNLLFVWGNCNFSEGSDFVHAPATELMAVTDLQYDDWLTAGSDLLSVVSFFYNHIK